MLMTESAYGTCVFNQKKKTHLFFTTNSSPDFKLNTPTYLMSAFVSFFNLVSMFKKAV